MVVCAHICVLVVFSFYWCIFPYFFLNTNLERLSLPGLAVARGEGPAACGGRRSKAAAGGGARRPRAPGGGRGGGVRTLGTRIP